MAASMLARSLEAAGVAAGVDSAGTRADGQPVVPEVVEVLGRRGLTLRRLESRRLDAAAVAAADLILGMERAHVREAVTLAPAAWPRSFTIKEVVRRGGTAGGRRSDESLDGWLARVAAGRRAADLLGEDRVDDVADPIGRPIAAFEAAAEELSQLARLFADLVAAQEPRRD